MIHETDPSNTEQLRNWDGESGEFWAENATRYDEGVAAYRPHFLAAAGYGVTDAVLDVGCGSGSTTRDAARLATSGSAHGIDLSSQMLALARTLAAHEELTNATFEQGDAQTHPFPGASFDVAVSRSGAMFFGDPVAAFSNIGSALRPGGRLVLLAWQPFASQEWLRCYFAALSAGRDLTPPGPDVPGPFALSEPDRVREVLGAAGFADIELRGLTEPMYAGPDAADATRFIADERAGMLRDLAPDARQRAIEELHATMAAHQTDRGVLFESAAWLIRARRPVS